MPDYSKTTIYKLCCNDTEIKDIYIGSTCNFTQRRWCHKSTCNNENGNAYNVKVYQFIREHGGFENWSMVMIHEQSVNNKLEKERLERTFIEDLKPSLNSQLPSRTQKEYRSDNKEQIREQSSQKYDCECGGNYTHTHKQRHFRSAKHQKFISEHTVPSDLGCKSALKEQPYEISVQ